MKNIIFRSFQLLCCGQTDAERIMILLSPSSDEESLELDWLWNHTKFCVQNRIRSHRHSRTKILCLPSLKTLSIARTKNSPGHGEVPSVTGPSCFLSFFQRTNKLFLSEQATGVQLKEFVRKNAANALSMANMLMGMASILCSLNGHQHAACWLVLIGYLLDLADGAVARRLDACSPLGAKLDDFADFTTFGIATSLLLRTHALMDNILCMCYVLSVFVRLCFFSSGIPFMYRGLPCIYSSAILACLSLLTGGNMVILRVTAVAMILFMVNQGFYPHDRVLESQAWKKVVYAGEMFKQFFKKWMFGPVKSIGMLIPGASFVNAAAFYCQQTHLPGVVMVFCSSFSPACVYYLLWSVSYILFPTSLWSCKV
ncbi:transmembrane protein 269 isoform X2 [Oncorhynchus mykiss]|uniref:transmembrane protein 269 isoform X2 n=1 Tax=Oncorhynchus mykiss TaxID=8022 RepID=UPI001878D024|nr:transmembrane protein 269 isoform X2 [Oncorhynchus mykiss]